MIFGLFCAGTIVIAAVSVVFPWSTCPIVPTFTCCFVRSNFCFAIGLDLLVRTAGGPRHDDNAQRRDKRRPRVAQRAALTTNARPVERTGAGGVRRLGASPVRGGNGRAEPSL